MRNCHLHRAVILVIPLILIQQTVFVSSTNTDIVYYLMKYMFTAHSNRSADELETTSPLPRRLVQGGGVDVVRVGTSDLTPHFDKSAMSTLSADDILVSSRNPRVAMVVNSSFLFYKGDHNGHINTYRDNATDVALTVVVSTRSIGKTAVDIYVVGYPISGDFNSSARILIRGNESHQRRSRQMRILASFDITVTRRTIYKSLSLAFTVFVATITTFTTFLIGTKLDLEIVLKALKSPASLLLGVAIEFCLMPLVALLWAVVILRGNNAWQLAYLAIGACPGGGHSPFWTMMLEGNLDLAVAMSFVASVCALGILPFWLFTVGRIFYAGRFKIPYLTNTASLFALVCPIFLGLLLKQYFPIWAERIGRIVKHVTLVSFIITAAFGCAVNSYVFSLLEWQHMLCGLLLPWCGFAVSYALSRWPFRRSHKDCIAIAVENGCLNVAVPTVLIQLTLPQLEADLALVVPVGVVIFAQWPLWICAGILFVQKRMTATVSPLQERVDVASIAAQGNTELHGRQRSAKKDPLDRSTGDTNAGSWTEENHPAFVCEVVQVRVSTQIDTGNGGNA